MRVVGFDGRFNISQCQAAVGLMVEWLRLHAAKHRRAAAFPAVAMRHLADDVFVTALAVAEQPAQIALGAGRYKQRRFKAQHIGNLVLQGIDAGVAREHIVAQQRGLHGGAHAWRGLGDGVTAQID